MPANRCPTCKRLIKRSTQANRRYWLILHMMSDKIKPRGQTYSAESWHRYCASRFLGCTDIPMPNGKTIVMPRSTADLDTAEFNDYQTQVEVFANEHNCYLEDEAFPV